eukprot:4010000-Amphidinium_carterae.1
MDAQDLANYATRVFKDEELKLICLHKLLNLVSSGISMASGAIYSCEELQEEHAAGAPQLRARMSNLPELPREAILCCLEAFAYKACDSPLCDQLIFLFEWLLDALLKRPPIAFIALHVHSR